MPHLHSTVKQILTLGIFLGTGMANAHEFWIQPEDYRLEPEQMLVADIRVGVDFLGDTQAYISSTINRFTLADANGMREVSGRLGDIPAVNVMPETGGLQVLSLFTTTSVLTWDAFQEFEDFANLHGMGWVLEAHAERGLPDTGFKEGYTRFVKSLTAVGDGAGQDRFTGMFFELVAGLNPYTDDISAGMPITVLFKGEPLPDKQVDLFFRNPEGELSRVSVISDAQGLAVMPNMGTGEYMINTVHMIQPFAADIERTGVVWHSLWGSITYALGQ